MILVVGGTSKQTEANMLMQHSDKPLTALKIKIMSISVPLKEISVDFKILGFVAEVTSTLLYTNSEDSPIEAEFTFPVDDSSAVFKFEAEIEGRQIVAEIQEKEQVSIY